MWIRSQNREVLMKADEVFYEKDPICEEYDLHSGNELLGTYKSKKRCIEVIGEIQLFLNGFIKKHNELVEHHMGVFEMPEK